MQDHDGVHRLKDLDVVVGECDVERRWRPLKATFTQCAVFVAIRVSYEELCDPLRELALARLRARNLAIRRVNDQRRPMVLRERRPCGHPTVRMPHRDPPEKVANNAWSRSGTVATNSAASCSVSDVFSPMSLGRSRGVSVLKSQTPCRFGCPQGVRCTASSSADWGSVQPERSTNSPNTVIQQGEDIRPFVDPFNGTEQHADTANQPWVLRGLERNCRIT